MCILVPVYRLIGCGWRLSCPLKQTAGLQGRGTYVIDRYPTVDLRRRDHHIQCIVLRAGQRLVCTAESAPVLPGEGCQLYGRWELLQDPVHELLSSLAGLCLQ